MSLPRVLGVLAAITGVLIGLLAAAEKPPSPTAGPSNTAPEAAAARRARTARVR